MNDPRTRIPPSIPADRTLLEGATLVLAEVEDLPEDACGVLRFEDHGMVLVEHRRICWAVAKGMEKRLSDLLRHQRQPPLDRKELEGILRRCRTSGTPLGEALLESGQITEDGLRSALFRQATEAVAHIARASTLRWTFHPHTSARYDARFLFSPVEVFCALGARRDRVMAAAARRALEAQVPDDAVGFAFLTDASERVSVVVSVVGELVFRVPAMLDACSWATALFDIAALVDPGVSIASGRWADGGRQFGLGGSKATVLAWRAMGMTFCALCATQGSAALLTSRLAQSMEGRDR